ncbi:MAG: STAS/SEC14 domain-containing protein [Hyphomonadaceae bacterium]
MIEFLPESHDAVLGVRASGKLSDMDYRTTLLPRLEPLFAQYGRVRLLFSFAPDFEGWEWRAAMDDAELGLRRSHGFERIAIVGGPAWVSASANVLKFLIDAEVKTFDARALAEAWLWVEADASAQ